MPTTHRNFRFRFLDPADQGVFVEDTGDLTNDIVFGTRGNVTMMDVEWEGDFPTETIEMESPLEELISDLADEAGDGAVSWLEERGYLG